MGFGHFFQVPVNYLAVLLCGISNMIIGYLWYGPLFGKQWEKLVGLTSEKKIQAKKNMPKLYVAMFLSSLVMAYVLFHFIWYAAPGSYTLFIALKTAFWAWVGFVATVGVTKFLVSPERKSTQLLFIENGYYFVVLLIMSFIFYVLK